jgi:hypothetical protein
MHLIRTGPDRFLIFYRELDGSSAIADPRTSDRAEAKHRMRELEEHLARAAARGKKSVPERRRRSPRVVVLRKSADEPQEVVRERITRWVRSLNKPARRSRRSATEPK